MQEDQVINKFTVDCGILNLVESGDSIMADKGFNIENHLPDGVSLNIPPFMRDKEYLTIEKETKTRRIAMKLPFPWQEI